MLSIGNIARDPTVDSAISVADADAYHSKRGNTAWAALNEAAKEILLVKAADYIRVTYASVWSPIVSTSLTAPLAMMKANAELALSASSAPLIPTATRGKKRVKVGPLEVEYDDASTVKTQFVYASRLLTPLLGNTASRAMAKLVRC